jgi:hypothetical protein
MGFQLKAADVAVPVEEEMHPGPGEGAPAGARSPAGPAGRPRPGAEAPWLLLLLAAYLAPLLIVSPAVEVPLIDDWNHALSVRHLVEEGRLWIANWTATTLVFQVFWGALFAAPFGFSFTTLRLSTLALSFAASLALYLLCREFDVSPPRAFLGALTLWLNPIVFGLSYTFMSDIPFLALYLLATLFSVRGVARARRRDLFAGSCFAALAFLVRHQGALIPLGVLLYGLLARWPPRLFLRRLPAVASAPALAVAGYLAWSRSAGLPRTQGEYIQTLLRDGPRLWNPALTLAGYVLVYLGLFWLPLALGLLPGGARALATRARAPGTRALILAWGVAILALVAFFALRGSKPDYVQGGLVVHPHGAWMPYLEDGSMIHSGGLAPDDLRGARPRVLNGPARVALTALAALALFLLGALPLARARRRGAGVAPASRRLPLGLLGTIGLFQFAGIYLPSIRIMGGDWISFDRYLLPLAPLAIVLGLRAAREVRLSPALVTVGLAGFLLYSLVGTQDWLSYNHLRWELGNELVARGIALEQIDAGMEWDGWHLYEPSQARKIAKPRTPDGPFWTHLIATAVDSTYVVTFSPLPGYDTLWRGEYPSWLHREPVYLYVQQRAAPPPPPPKP